MKSQDDFQSFLQELQRPINCLVDDDRNIRRGGLTTIKQRIKGASKDHILKLLTQTRLTNLLCKTVGDKIEGIRQLTLDSMEMIINKVGEDGKMIYEIVIPALIQRVNETPFPENSEDLRLKIIELLIKLVKFRECMLKYMAELCGAISKCLLDGYDQIKLGCCTLINFLASNLRHEVGKHSINMVKSLGENLTHQKFKVRKASLQSIGKVLVTEGAGPHLEYVRAGLKATLSDKKMEVRNASLQCASHLLHYLSPKYMKEYEANLIGFLLMGLNDESGEVRKKSIELLDKCGKRLSEEDSMKDEQEEEQNV